MKAENGMNRTPILTGILHPFKAKPHVKKETVLYHQPILTSQTMLLPRELCPEHPDTWTYCGCAFVFREKLGLSHLFCAPYLLCILFKIRKASALS